MSMTNRDYLELIKITLNNNEINARIFEPNPIFSYNDTIYIYSKNIKPNMSQDEFVLYMKNIIVLKIDFDKEKIKVMQSQTELITINLSDPNVFDHLITIIDQNSNYLKQNQIL